MKSTMTERDKKLLTFMFMIVIIVGIGYWGIRPQIKRYIELGPKIEAQENTKEVNNLKMNNYMIVEGQAEDYEDLIAERKDEFYQIMTSSEIDRMMTEMAINNGLDIYELSFNMPTEPTSRTAYQYSELKTWQDQMELTATDDEEEDDFGLSDLSGGSDSEDDETETTASASDKQKIMEEVMADDSDIYKKNTDIYAVPVTITVAGELSDLEAFKEDILNIEKRTLLTSYAWGEYREVVTEKSTASTDTDSEEGVTSEELEEETNYKVVTRKTLTVKLEIYMCDTSSIDDSAVEDSAETSESED